MPRAARIPQSITTIDQLVRTLNAVPARDYESILARLDIPEEEVEPWCRWNKKHYTRTCITRNDSFELLVICYEAGQRTSIHDYDSQAAWIHPIRGEVLEERFAQGHGRLVRRSATRLTPGSFSTISNEHSIHRFTNPSGGRTITLNLYARPLRKWRVYDERTGEQRDALPE